MGHKEREVLSRPCRELLMGSVSLNQGDIGFSSMQLHHCSDLRREHGPARDSGKINNGLVCVLVLSLGLAGFTDGSVIWPSPRFMCVSGVPQLPGFPEGSPQRASPQSFS